MWFLTEFFGTFDTSRHYSTQLPRYELVIRLNV
jgi:hypothetical protein